MIKIGKYYYDGDYEKSETYPNYLADKTYIDKGHYHCNFCQHHEWHRPNVGPDYCCCRDTIVEDKYHKINNEHEPHIDKCPSFSHKYFDIRIHCYEGKLIDSDHREAS